jgi:hypothetical protein
MLFTDVFLFDGLGFASFAIVLRRRSDGRNDWRPWTQSRRDYAKDSKRADGNRPNPDQQVHFHRDN